MITTNKTWTKRIKEESNKMWEMLWRIIWRPAEGDIRCAANKTCELRYLFAVPFKLIFADTVFEYYHMYLHCIGSGGHFLFYMQYIFTKQETSSWQWDTRTMTASRCGEKTNPKTVKQGF